MNRSFHFNWLACGISGLLMLSSCVGTDVEDESFPNDVEDVAAQQDPAAGDVAVSLTTSKTSLQENDSLAVTIKMTNTARYSVRLLSWYTAAEELEEDLFKVTRDGKPVDYIGPHYKRPAPQHSDYITLAPGESLTRAVQLSGFSDLSQSGDYSVQYAAELKQQAREQVVELDSNDVSLFIAGRTTDIPEVIGGDTANLASLAFTKCTASQSTTITSAIGAASTMADGSVSYLNGSPSGTPRYTTWFGAYTSNGWNTAKSHYVAIKDAIDTKPINVNCGCKKNYYAYVYPAQPYQIWVCNAFWTAPLTGTDSKGGTLIHELSHFTAVAGTDDYIYGQSGAKSLALSDPSKALFNADSHEYFAENTPSQQ